MSDTPPPLEPHTPPQRSPSRRPIIGPRAPGAYLPFPLWLRFTLVIVLTAGLLTAGALYVDHHNTNSPPTTNLAAEVQANRDAEILVAQDQVPHVVRLHSGVKAIAGLRLAVHGFMARHIAQGSLEGPLTRTSCKTDGPQGGAHLAFSCLATAGGVGYDFLAVVDTRTRQITYCKRDPPPAASDNVPVSPRCVA